MKVVDLEGFIISPEADSRHILKPDREAPGRKVLDEDGREGYTELMREERIRKTVEREV